MQAMMGGRQGQVGGARRNNFVDEVKSNLSNISMLNENNHSLKGADRASLKSRSLNQPSMKTKTAKSRRAAQRVLMDRSQNIGEMLRGGANALKATLQQPVCSPTEPSFIRFQSQRSCNSLSKAGSTNGRQGHSATNASHNKKQAPRQTRELKSSLKPKKGAWHDYYLNSPISKKLKQQQQHKRAMQDHKKNRLLQNNHRAQYQQTRPIQQ